MRDFIKLIYHIQNLNNKTDFKAWKFDVQAYKLSGIMWAVWYMFIQEYRFSEIV